MTALDLEALEAALRDPLRTESVIRMCADAADVVAEHRRLLAAVAGLCEAMTCRTCGGTGRIHDSIDTYEPCPDCGGTGHPSPAQALADATALHRAVFHDHESWDYPSGFRRDLYARTCYDRGVDDAYKRLRAVRPADETRAT